VYELPFGQGRTFMSNAAKPLDYALGGWILGWTFAAQGGTPVPLNQGYDYTCASFAPSHHANVSEWFNPLANTIVPNGATSCASSVLHIGGTGYTYNLTPDHTTQIRNPTVPDLDLSLEKTFKVTERFKFQLRGEAFNALNSVLLGSPDTNPGDTPAALFDNATTNRNYWTGFGTVGPTQLNFPRNLRVSGKFIF
jgi:hypothetical protein